jgi:hypothetical protein
MGLQRNLMVIIFFCFIKFYIFTIMKKNITLLLIIFLNLYAFGQEESISFSAYNHQKDKGFLIKIFEKENDLLIEYKLADTVSDLLKKDRKYKRLIKKTILNPNPENIEYIDIMKYAMEMDKIRDKYTQYKTDTLFIDNENNQNYINLYSEVTSSSKKVLENSIEGKFRIVLDGYSITFDITTETRTDRILLQSPNKESHPILYNFIKETFNIYREEKKNDFLDKEYTFGF